MKLLFAILIEDDGDYINRLLKYWFMVQKITQTMASYPLFTSIKSLAARSMSHAMTNKKISLKSLNPILIDATAALNAINELRKKHGEKKEYKLPINFEKLLRSTKVLEQRNVDHGQITFSLHYASCVRKFPNFGLEVVSASDMSVAGNEIAITVDVTVKAGNKKWQKDEIQECAAIFKRTDVNIVLEYTCDEQTEWAGHSTSLYITNGKIDQFGQTYLPISSLECIFN